MKRVSLRELPERLVAIIQPGTFLFAYALPERGRYIARYLRPEGPKEELEYDVELGRPLTVDERQRALPAEMRTSIPESAVTVVSRYSLDARTAELIVVLDVRDPAGGELFAVTKQVYDPTPWELRVVVDEELARRRFPAEYAAWPREHKVHYWARTLHRFRRVHGESGWDEDEIFTLALVHDMEQIDPRVRELLPEILALVGRLEQTPPQQMIAAFTSRTGVPLPWNDNPS